MVSVHAARDKTLSAQKLQFLANSANFDSAKLPALSFLLHFFPVRALTSFAYKSSIGIQ